MSLSKTTLLVHFHLKGYSPTPGNFHNRFYATSEEIPVIVMSPERFNFLIKDKEFENSLPKRLQIIKDMVVFGCTTAVRYSDLCKANRTNLEYIGNRVYFCIISQKTNNTSRVYLPDYAKTILLKYKRRKHSLFPPLSRTNFNKAIKQIALLAGWTEELTVTRSKRGEHFEQYKDEAKKKIIVFVMLYLRTLCDVLPLLQC